MQDTARNALLIFPTLAQAKSAAQHLALVEGLSVSRSGKLVHFYAASHDFAKAMWRAVGAESCQLSFKPAVLAFISPNLSR